MKRHLVNFHIPKSAGSALRANLAASFASAELPERYVLGVEPGNGVDHFEGLTQRFAAEFPKIFDQSDRMISGHFRYRDVADIIAPQRGRVSLITFLRDPIWRTLSDYYYSISAKHDDAEAFNAMYPTFDHYMSNPGEMNKMCSFLCLEESDSAQKILQQVFRDFDFVGVTENFTDDLLFIANSVRRSVESEKRENENRNKDVMLQAYDKYAPKLKNVLKNDYILFDGILEQRGLKKRS
ncbi:sulfotransferase family 2 domain-containing protein [Planktotalea sp.]|uniref:sulfotransferase family 2 domain-containing protein n=1 Tax=Planktotalea sp. TaxID=2029877 RepID=UPI003298F715